MERLGRREKIEADLRARFNVLDEKGIDDLKYFTNGVEWLKRLNPDERRKIVNDGSSAKAQFDRMVREAELKRITKDEAKELQKLIKNTREYILGKDYKSATSALGGMKSRKNKVEGENNE
jgi:hypothetical protein